MSAATPQLKAGFLFKGDLAYPAPMEVGNRIRFWRRQADLSQAQVSERCGWGKTNTRLSKYERNISQPGLSELELICNAVGITLNQFFVELPQSVNGITRDSLKNLTSREKVDLLAQVLTPEEFSQVFQEIFGKVLPK